MWRKESNQTKTKTINLKMEPLKQWLQINNNGPAALEQTAAEASGVLIHANQIFMCLDPHLN